MEMAASFSSVAASEGVNQTLCFAVMYVEQWDVAMLPHPLKVVNMTGVWRGLHPPHSQAEGVSPAKGIFSSYGACRTRVQAWVLWLTAWEIISVWAVIFSGCWQCWEAETDTISQQAKQSLLQSVCPGRKRQNEEDL